MVRLTFKHDARRQRNKEKTGEKRRSSKHYLNTWKYIYATYLSNIHDAKNMAREHGFFVRTQVT